MNQHPTVLLCKVLHEFLPFLPGLDYGYLCTKFFHAFAFKRIDRLRHDDMSCKSQKLARQGQPLGMIAGRKSDRRVMSDPVERL